MALVVLYSRRELLQRVPIIGTENCAAAAACRPTRQESAARGCRVSTSSRRPGGAGDGGDATAAAAGHQGPGGEDGLRPARRATAAGRQVRGRLAAQPVRGVGDTTAGGGQKKVIYFWNDPTAALASPHHLERRRRSAVLTGEARLLPQPVHLAHAADSFL